MHQPNANLAAAFGIRQPVPPRAQLTLAERDRRQRCVLREAPPRLAFAT